MDYYVTVKLFRRTILWNNIFSKMVLYKYFKLCRKVTCNMLLPDPKGPLSKAIDSETIKELNNEVTALVNSSTIDKRSPYLKVTAT